MDTGTGTTRKPISRYRNYWVFSAGLGVAWVIVIIVRVSLGGGNTLRDVLTLLAGFVIGWITMTIARYIYPPGRNWQEYYRSHD